MGRGCKKGSKPALAAEKANALAAKKAAAAKAAKEAAVAKAAEAASLKKLEEAAIKEAVEAAKKVAKEAALSAAEEAALKAVSSFSDDTLNGKNVAAVLDAARAAAKDVALQAAEEAANKAAATINLEAVRKAATATFEFRKNATTYSSFDDMNAQEERRAAVEALQEAARRAYEAAKREREAQEAFEAARAQENEENDAGEWESPDYGPEVARLLEQQELKFLKREQQTYDQQQHLQQLLLQNIANVQPPAANDFRRVSKAARRRGFSRSFKYYNAQRENNLYNTNYNDAGQYNGSTGSQSTRARGYSRGRPWNQNSRYHRFN